MLSPGGRGTQQGGRSLVFRMRVLMLSVLSFNVKSLTSVGAVPVALPGGTASPGERLNKPPKQAWYPSGYKRCEFEPFWAKKGNLQVI